MNGQYQLHVALEHLQKTMPAAAFERYQRMLLWAKIVPWIVPAVYFGLPATVSFGRQHLSQDWFALVTGLVAAISGWGLYKLRQTQRLAYGALEIAFAGWSALLVGKNLHGADAAPAAWAALAGTVYSHGARIGQLRARNPTVSRVD